MENPETPETVEAPETVETVDEINAKVQALLKKYKLTMYGMIACIVLYLISLFWIRNTIIVVIICIPMIACAVLNSRYSKQIRQLVATRNQMQSREEARKRAEEAGLDPDEMDLGDVNSGEAIVANASSLNDLPKEYTVLDDVDLDGDVIPHIILSPYGVAVVDSTDRTELITQKLKELDLEAPVYMYEPSEDIALLAENIQMPKEVVFTEPDIYKVLYSLTGLK